MHLPGIYDTKLMEEVCLKEMSTSYVQRESRWCDLGPDPAVRSILVTTGMHYRIGLIFTDSF